MRLRIYSADGTPQWGPNTPASTGSSRLGGELVVGAHGWVEQGRINARAAKARETAKKVEAPA